MRFAIVITLLLIVLSPQTSRGEDGLEGTMDEYRPAVETIAKGVAKVLVARREDAITVGSFMGPPSLGTAAGPGIRQLVIEELGRQKIRAAKLGTELGLSGEYRLAKSFPEASTSQMQLEVKLTDSSGQIVTDLASSLNVSEESQRFVREKTRVDEKKGMVIVDTNSSPEATALALGATADLDLYQPGPGGYDRYSSDFVKDLLEKSTALIKNGNELRASPTSPFGFQIKVNGSPRPLKKEGKHAFVQLNKGESFSLQVNNNAPFTIASTMTLDGVNAFAFSEIRQDGRSKYSRWIIQPYKLVDVLGWHKNNTEVQAFKVTDFAESAAALVGAEGQLGAISVVIRATWPFNSQPPPGEPMMPMALGAGAPGQGIGFGDTVRQKAQEDASKRDYGRVRAILTIRYDKPSE